MSWLQDFGLVFDIVISLLLVTAIGYAMAVNRKLTLLRDAKRDMEKLFAEFATATNEAQGGLQALKEGSGVAGEALARNVKDACRLADEMAFLVKKGNEIADRLEVAVAASRKAGQAPMQAPGRAPAQAPVRQVPVHQAPVHQTPVPSQAPSKVAAPAAGPLARDPLQAPGTKDLAARESSPAQPARGIARFTKRKLSGADSELMRALQAIR